MDGEVIISALNELKEQLKKSPPNDCNWMYTIDSLINVIKDQQTMIDELRKLMIATDPNIRNYFYFKENKVTKPKSLSWSLGSPHTGY